jgi:Mannosyltransferase (PIG-V)
MSDARQTPRATLSAIGSSLSAWVRTNAAPLIIFLASRTWLLLIVAASILLVPNAQCPPNAMRPSMPSQTLRTVLVDPWTRWDGEWYRRIAVNGYTNLALDETGQRDTAFFPLYPIAIRLLAAVVGDVDLAGLLVSNAALLATLILLHRLVRLHSEPATANGAVLLLAFFPFSYFLGAMYSESLFLLAIVCAFTFGEQERWWAAGLAGALAGLTRVTGVLIVPGLMLLYLEQRRFDLRQLRWNGLWILTALLGPALHAAFLQARFGDAFLFVRSQNVPGWGAGVDLPMALDTARNALTGSLGGQSILPLMHALHLLVWCLALAISFLAWGKPRIAYGVWATLMVLASFSLWRSAGRYAATLFPLFIVGALLVGRRRGFPWLLLAGGLALVVLSVLFAHSIWTG